METLKKWYLSAVWERHALLWSYFIVEIKFIQSMDSQTDWIMLVHVSKLFLFTLIQQYF